MEFQNNYPIYLQIADDIKRRIVIGELHPGDKLPSNTDLAVAYTVNPNTVQRICRQLEVEGITFTRRGVGTFLSEDPELAERLRSTILEQEVTAFLKKMQQYHFSKAALFTAMEQQLEQAEKKEETEGVCPCWAKRHWQKHPDESSCRTGKTQRWHAHLQGAANRNREQETHCLHVHRTILL